MKEFFKAWLEIIKVLPRVANWYAEQIPAKLDDFTSRVRENTGQDPDWVVERRRAKRKSPEQDS